MCQQTAGITTLTHDCSITAGMWPGFDSVFGFIIALAFLLALVGLLFIGIRVYRARAA